MKFLFIHQNFPGQFKHVAPRLAALGHEVVALGVNQTQPRLPGVRHLFHVPQAPAEAVSRGLSASLSEYHTKFLRGSSAAQAMQALRAEGFEPDVVFAHPGWGEALFARDVFPKARHLMYAEYYYGAPGGDVGFDAEFATNAQAARLRARVKNTHLLQAMEASDGGLSPTSFQRGQHPPWFQSRIEVIHDGIDTARFQPDPSATVSLRSAGLSFRPGDEVVTYIARELEPYRGYHTFMRSLPRLQKLRPRAHVVLVGGSGVSYGAPAPEGQSWKEIFLREVDARIDRSRIHFVGRVPHAVLTQLLQVSAAHVYLTYPFVLSWSALEAMSIGCLMIGSRTAPVEEVIEHGHNGLLVDFFDSDMLAETIGDALARGPELAPLRQRARQTVVERYDLSARCLPRWVDWLTRA